MAVLLVVAAAGLRDLEAAAVALAVVAAAVLVGWRKGLLGSVGLALLSANVAFWMGTGALSNLAHGEKRALELAIALVQDPKLLLLDEPMAGTGREETSHLVDLLNRLRHDYGILLVEHDMQAVFALADRISVMDYGRIIASGRPEEIRENPEVRQAYLGEELV
jgi:ABC-type branched-subunit amino acid transport system ATPase component